MRVRTRALWFVFVLVLLAACAQQPEEAPPVEAEPAPEPSIIRAVAKIEPTAGNEVTGTAWFQNIDGRVFLMLKIENAPPGEHAFHLHEVGDCTAPDGSSAGGHWNPTGVDHGKWGEAAFHLGDVGNLVVGDDGSFSGSVEGDRWTVGTGADNDVIGRSVVLHAGADDYTSQPSGAAGARIACGVIVME